MFGSIGLPEILIVLLIAFLIFGAKKLPELGAGLGKAIRSFNKGVKGDEEIEGKKDSSSKDD
jgi:sec-independent protein translocase protein TatA